MKHCNICGVDVATDKNYCPLCFNEIDGACDEKPVFLTNTKKEIFNKQNFLATKILAFLSISLAVVCGFINFVTYTGVLWSLLVGSTLAYLWILIKHTILSNRNAFEKIFFQLVSIITIVVCAYIVSGGGDWLLNFVVPSIAICTSITLGMVSVFNKHRKNLIVSFFVIYILLVVLSIVLLACKFDTFKILNEINLVINGLIVLGTILFGHKTLKTELSKKLHL